MELTSNLYKPLSHSAELTKSLQYALSAASLTAGEDIRISRQLSDMKAQAESLESLLAELSEKYKAAESTAKQQIWERKLLDLSMRNNLLNMRLGKNTIRLLGDSIPADISVLEDELDMGKEFVLDQKELKGIYRAVRTNLEESGANTLFLTLGTLKWTEKVGGREHLAPILLVPIEMVSMKKGQYAIRKRDEDVILNITLMEFLKQNYDISMEGLSPLPQDAHGIDVSLVLHKMSEAIEEQKDWEIIEESLLGIFSFTKFVMWNDIHTHASAMAASPLVKSLIEGRLLVNDDIHTVDAREQDVNSQPMDFAIPMDTDSSQLEAVIEGERGRSFVLFGPPGTGKSQTITNIIANALYHDKRVLFVAQKKAALDVVENRLKKIGLAPFCLELHSNKMDKKHFLCQMEESLLMESTSSDENFGAISTELYNQRLKLRGYIDALHAKHTNGISLYECTERYLAIQENAIELPKDFYKGLSIDDADRICDRIKALDAAVSILGGMSPSNHPLRGFLPKPQKKAEKPVYVSKYTMGDTIEEQLKLLPQIVAGIKQQVERGKSMSFMNKTTRQYVEGDFKLKKFLKLADIDNALYDDIDALAEAADRWVANISLLPQWQQYADILNGLREEGLAEVVNGNNNGVATDVLCQMFKKAYFYQTAQNIILQDARLGAFNGIQFEQVISKYNQLTKEFQLLTQRELVARLSARNPMNDKSSEMSTEITLLRKRIGNKGRGTSIRSIIEQMPHLLPRLCPVMLMSPLSVAQYLDVEGDKFDIVIFDEASQMPTSEAVGAIARGKSVIVVGDSKQMPPTSFFSVNTVDDEETDIDDMESILDDCISLSMPARYLGWHYRSKHESLIAFSNQNYYEGRLVTFPSSDNMVSHVTWQHVDSYYDFGKTRTNQAEAEAIVADAIERMQRNPDKSIGIVAFSKQQSDLIEDVLNERMAGMPELIEQNNASAEPLFVKNLENVQGDERDVILFSVGYGPDKEGKVSMNFGPLNKAGGERRLNVAVSRARYEMKVFSTLKPEQIDERRTDTEGVLGLKRFLQFAQNGTSVSANVKSANTNNRIAKEIAEALTQRGYDVHVGIGTGICRLDIGVVNPANPSEYILGLIIDGDDYFRMKTVRDREVVRPSVLQMLGWRLMHVWTLDWFMHKDLVIKNILTQLQS